MKRLIVAGSVMAVMTGGAGAVLAEPGPNGNNTFGLCTAYFAGNDTAREHKRNAPPFAALIKAAEDNDQSVEEYCTENGQRPGNGGGRP
jgi:hypothetical protein